MSTSTEHETIKFIIYESVANFIILANKVSGFYD